MEMSDIEFGRTYSQADISGLFENIFRFRIPDRFMPDGSLISLGQIMFGNDVVVSQAVMPPHPYTNQSDFLERQPQGYYAIGHWGHGLNSYRFCYRVAERNRVIWLEIPYGGVFQNEEQDARDIESYLSELVSFLEKADRAGIDVEVIESMGIGDYRLFDAEGNGIHFEGSLLGATDLTRRFNWMLADFAVFAVERKTGMPQFTDDDPGYMRWLVRNPNGWVLNADRQPKADYLVLHRSTCWTISRSSVRYTSGDFLKRCDSDPQNLSDWAVSQTGNTPDVCQKCSA